MNAKRLVELLYDVIVLKRVDKLKELGEELKKHGLTLERVTVADIAELLPKLASEVPELSDKIEAIDTELSKHILEAHKTLTEILKVPEVEKIKYPEPQLLFRIAEIVYLVPDVRERYEKLKALYDEVIASNDPGIIGYYLMATLPLARWFNDYEMIEKLRPFKEQRYGIIATQALTITGLDYEIKQYIISKYYEIREKLEKEVRRKIEATIRKWRKMK